MRKKVDKSTHVEVIAIHKRLEQSCKKLEGGLCAYDDGVDDASIAAEIGVSPASVAGIRLSLFGKHRPSAPAQPTDPRIDELVRVNANILKAYDEVVDRHNKLVAMLALNRVVDCKHLALPGPK